MFFRHPPPQFICTNKESEDLAPDVADAEGIYTHVLDRRVESGLVFKTYTNVQGYGSKSLV